MSVFLLNVFLSYRFGKQKAQRKASLTFLVKRSDLKSGSMLHRDNKDTLHKDDPIVAFYNNYRIASFSVSIRNAVFQS